MSLEEEFLSLAPRENTLLTIGVFDGIHLGHQKLLSQLVSRAHEEGCQSGVITFKNHPLSQLGKHQAPPMLAGIKEKDLLIKEWGVDFIIHLEFSSRLAHTSARDFCRMMQDYLNMQGLVLGFDFAMGRNREGTLKKMQTLGREMGFGVEIVPPVKMDGEIVSSTTIRQAITEGNINKASAQLGRYYSLSGNVITGRGLGKKLGFPTANIQIDPGFALPPNGIYATMAYLNDQPLFSATNIGIGPTFGGGRQQIEVHLLDFNNNVYGKTLSIEFIERIRDELKFNSEIELKEQIVKDIEAIRQILERKVISK